jgi:hypothetical protein
MTALRFSTLLVGAAFTLTACEQTPTAPARSGVPLPTFQAVTQTDDTIFPIDLVVFVPCANGGAGELIEVSGPLHVLMQLTISSSGNVSVYSHFQPQGITGTGFTTGAKYQGTGITESKDNFNGLPISSTFVNNFYMIGQGPGNNYKVHETLHYTINANGTPTAYIDNFFVTCK